MQLRPISGSALFDVAAIGQLIERELADSLSRRRPSRTAMSVGVPTIHAPHDRVRSRFGPGVRRFRRRPRRCDRRPRIRPPPRARSAPPTIGWKSGLPMTSTSQNANTAKMRLNSGPGGRDRHALAARVCGCGPGRALGRDLAFALVEHLDVAAERNRRDHEIGAVAVAARPQRLAESDREPQHLDAAAARDDEMAELVEGDQHAQRDDQPPDGTEDLTHATFPDSSSARICDAATRRHPRRGGRENGRCPAAQRSVLRRRDDTLRNPTRS